MTDSIAEVERIAAGLTKGEADVLCGRQRARGLTQQNLEQKGLVRCEGFTSPRGFQRWKYVQTPLGEQVRAHLMGLEA